MSSNRPHEDDPLAPHRGRLLGLAYRMLGSRSDAEAVVQDAYLRAYVGPEDCAHGFAAAATVDYAGYETFFLAAADAFADEPTTARLEALYGVSIPLHDAALFQRMPLASPISHAAAHRRLGWTPTTRWTAEAITA